MCPFSENELQEIESLIYHKSKEIDIEFLISKKPKNIILFSYDDFPNDILKSIICNFGTTSNILGITDYNYPELVAIVMQVKGLQRQGLDADQIKIILNLENKFPPLAIENAITSIYYNSDCTIKAIPVLDAVSPLWKKNRK